MSCLPAICLMSSTEVMGDGSRPVALWRVSVELESREEQACISGPSREITFIFREEGEALETIHIHNSMPFGEIQRGVNCFQPESGKRNLSGAGGELRRREQKYIQQARFHRPASCTIQCPAALYSLREGKGHRIVNVEPDGVGALRIQLRGGIQT